MSERLFMSKFGVDSIDVDRVYHNDSVVFPLASSVPFMVQSTAFLTLSTDLSVFTMPCDFV